MQEMELLTEIADLAHALFLGECLSEPYVAELQSQMRELLKELQACREARAKMNAEKPGHMGTDRLKRRGNNFGNTLDVSKMVTNELLARLQEQEQA